MVANYGSRLGSINTARSIKRDHILELYMLQDDWTGCRADADSGIGVFAEYTHPDLLDELGAHTVTDVQPIIPHFGKLCPALIKRNGLRLSTLKSTRWLMS